MTILCDTCERGQGVVESARTRARGRETRGAAGSGGFSVASAWVGGVPNHIAIDL